MKSLLSHCKSRWVLKQRQISAASSRLNATNPITIRDDIEPMRVPRANGAQEAIDPTHVPRAKGVQDGSWSKLDASLVELAQKDPGSKALDKYDLVLLGKSANELAKLATTLGQPAFRGKQLLDGLLKGARSIEDIKVIPQGFKDALIKAGTTTGRSIIHMTSSSPCGTTKFLLQLNDGRVIETVGIPVEESEDGETRGRLTVCVSSQVGCPMRCTFCATGKGGFARNLTPGEIIDQVLTVQEHFKQRVSNIVYMGMGEPMLNLKNVTASCLYIQEVLGLSARSITISTVGVPQTIARLAQESIIKATLAVSIHAPNQELREKIIPSAKAYPLSALMSDIKDYYKTTGRRVTFEYTLLKDVNDQDSHAREICTLLKRYDLLSHINIIPWNKIQESDFERPSNNRAFAFRQVCENMGLPTSIRMTRGSEAGAACGQLRNSNQKVPLSEPKKLH